MISAARRQGAGWVFCVRRTSSRSMCRMASSGDALREWDKEALVEEVLRLQRELKGRRGDEDEGKLLSSSASALSVSAVGGENGNRKKNGKELSFDRRRMVALRVGYVGWMFDGFALQKTKANTVEGRLLEALRRTKLIDGSMNSEELCWTRGGRTDIGVSAVGNVVGAKLRSRGGDVNEEFDYARMLNGVLPEGLRILAWAPAVDSGEQVAGRRQEMIGAPFSARGDAISRTYKYFFFGQGLNIEAMRVASRGFVGKHDFRNFCKADCDNNPRLNFERVMLKLDIQPTEAPRPPLGDKPVMYEIVICGYAFLWHQIRCMVAVLFMVGRGCESPDIVERMLNVADDSIFSDGKPNYRMASELPLVFYGCDYPTEVVDFSRFRADPKMISRHIEANIHEMWHRVNIQSTILDCFMKTYDTLRTKDGPTWSNLRASSARRPLLLDVDPQKQPMEKRKTGDSVNMKGMKRRLKDARTTALSGIKQDRDEQFATLLPPES